MLSPLEETLLAIMMAVIMLGMGSSLTFKDFRIAMRHPQAIGIGFASQYLFMPLIAFLIGRALQLPPIQAVSLILMGCVPGGTTSNIFAYFSRSLLGLSILMTVCSTLLAVVMVPLVLTIYTTGIDAAFRIPSGNIVAVLGVLLVPTLFGMWLRRRNANLGACTELMGGILGVVVIVFLIATWVPRNWQLLMTTGPEIYLAAIGLGLCGFLIGYWFSRAARLNPLKARTVSLETGIQNGPLAVLIITLSFAGETQQQMLLIPVMYSLFIVITSTCVTFYYRARSLREELARDRAKVETAVSARG
ncbi:bile acid:Na+ symporter, BASS family [Franzmannia pantelleriensis]|uniref:Bile acid:Na+ symporter, BASS family n=1 Tax=Franzmannia pantelleriensis TaxID=48727 RepID=A0A1G9R6T2_9GAMM|nr:bile acid:sodium symporter [Halomonas pantelleriensis]SDM18830.1 bile acid:Na+ symporter, BASS family [Halomonas pantelleriensis]